MAHDEKRRPGAAFGCFYFAMPGAIAQAGFI